MPERAGSSRTWACWNFRRPAGWGRTTEEGTFWGHWRPGGGRATVETPPKAETDGSSTLVSYLLLSSKVLPVFLLARLTRRQRKGAGDCSLQRRGQDWGLRDPLAEMFSSGGLWMSVRESMHLRKCRHYYVCLYVHAFR